MFRCSVVLPRPRSRHGDRAPRHDPRAPRPNCRGDCPAARRRTTLLNSHEQLAALLARHGRLAERRAAAATDESWDAVQRLARLLENRGDVEGAIAAYRLPDGLVAHDPNLAFDLAQLLTRHGRENEAIDVMRVQAAARNSA